MIRIRTGQQQRQQKRPVKGHAEMTGAHQQSTQCHGTSPTEPTIAEQATGV